MHEILREFETHIDSLDASGLKMRITQWANDADSYLKRLCVNMHRSSMGRKQIKGRETIQLRATQDSVAAFTMMLYTTRFNKTRGVYEYVYTLFVSDIEDKSGYLCASVKMFGAGDLDTCQVTFDIDDDKYTHYLRPGAWEAELLKLLKLQSEQAARELNDKEKAEAAKLNSLLSGKQKYKFL